MVLGAFSIAGYFVYQQQQQDSAVSPGHNLDPMTPYQANDEIYTPLTEGTELESNTPQSTSDIAMNL